MKNPLLDLKRMYLNALKEYTDHLGAQWFAERTRPPGTSSMLRKVTTIVLFVLAILVGILLLRI